MLEYVPALSCSALREQVPVAAPPNGVKPVTVHKVVEPLSTVAVPLGATPPVPDTVTVNVTDDSAP